MRPLAGVIAALALALALAAPEPAAAGNRPCAGKKGGVVACDRGAFVCRDGSVSASKRRCLG